MTELLKNAVTTAVLSFAMLASATPAQAATLTFDVTGIESIGALFASGNRVELFDIGADSHVTGISYDLTIEAFSPSWLSEISIAFADSDFLGGVLISPGTGDNVPGVESYSDTFHLVLEGLDFFVGSDGLLYVEFYEELDDPSVEPDGRYLSGTVRVEYEPVAAPVPEPATWAMMIGGFGLVGGAMRRRKVQVSYAA